MTSKQDFVDLYDEYLYLISKSTINNFLVEHGLGDHVKTRKITGEEFHEAIRKVDHTFLTEKDPRKRVTELVRKYFVVLPSVDFEGKNILILSGPDDLSLPLINEMFDPETSQKVSTLENMKSKISDKSIDLIVALSSFLLFNDKERTLLIKEFARIIKSVEGSYVLFSALDVRDDASKALASLYYLSKRQIEGLDTNLTSINFFSKNAMDSDFQYDSFTIEEQRLENSIEYIQSWKIAK